jgi:hypothetical protein
VSLVRKADNPLPNTRLASIVSCWPEGLELLIASLCSELMHMLPVVKFWQRLAAF